MAVNLESGEFLSEYQNLKNESVLWTYLGSGVQFQDAVFVALNPQSKLDARLLQIQIYYPESNLT